MAMRSDVVEYITLGIGIALSVLILDQLVGHASLLTQLLGLAIAGVLLASLQLLFVVWRRARQIDAPSSLERSPSRRRRHPSQNNPFIHELNSNWTGLEEGSLAKLSDRLINGTEQPHKQDM